MMDYEYIKGVNDANKENPFLTRLHIDDVNSQEMTVTLSNGVITPILQLVQAINNRQGVITNLSIITNELNKLESYVAKLQDARLKEQQQYIEAQQRAQQAEAMKAQQAAQQAEAQKRLAASGVWADAIRKLKEEVKEYLPTDVKLSNNEYHLLYYYSQVVSLEIAVRLVMNVNQFYDIVGDSSIVDRFKRIAKPENKKLMKAAYIALSLLDKVAETINKDCFAFIPYADYEHTGCDENLKPAIVGKPAQNGFICKTLDEGEIERLFSAKEGGKDTFSDCYELTLAEVIAFMLAKGEVVTVKTEKASTALAKKKARSYFTLQLTQRRDVDYRRNVVAEFALMIVFSNEEANFDNFERSAGDLRFTRVINNIIASAILQKAQYSIRGVAVIASNITDQYNAARRGLFGFEDRVSLTNLEWVELCVPTDKRCRCWLGGAILDGVKCNTLRVSRDISAYSDMSTNIEDYLKGVWHIYEGNNNRSIITVMEELTSSEYDLTDSEALDKDALLSVKEYKHLYGSVSILSLVKYESGSDWSGGLVDMDDGSKFVLLPESEINNRYSKFLQKSGNKAPDVVIVGDESQRQRMVSHLEYNHLPFKEIVNLTNAVQKLKYVADIVHKHIFSYVTLAEFDEKYGIFSTVPAENFGMEFCGGDFSTLTKIKHRLYDTLDYYGLNDDITEVSWERLGHVLCLSTIRSYVDYIDVGIEVMYNPLLEKYMLLSGETDLMRKVDLEDVIGRWLTVEEVKAVTKDKYADYLLTKEGLKAWHETVYSAAERIRNAFGWFDKNNAQFISNAIKKEFEGSVPCLPIKPDYSSLKDDSSHMIKGIPLVLSSNKKAYLNLVYDFRGDMYALTYDHDCTPNSETSSTFLYTDEWKSKDFLRFAKALGLGDFIHPDQIGGVSLWFTEEYILNVAKAYKGNMNK